VLVILSPKVTTTREITTSLTNSLMLAAIFFSMTSTIEEDNKNDKNLDCAIQKFFLRKNEL